jgi:hypothetical protein
MNKQKEQEGLVEKQCTPNGAGGCLVPHDVHAVVLPDQLAAEQSCTPNELAE